MSEERKPRCHNCIFGGHQFKIGKLTHLHCESPNTTKEIIESENPEPFDSLRVFNENCAEHVFKTKPLIRN